MKRIICTFVLLLLLLSLAGCGGKSVVDCDALADELTALDAFTSPLLEQSEKSLSTVVKLDTSLIESFHYSIAEGYTGEEFGVFTCISASAAKTLEQQLQARADSLTQTYSSYNQEALPRIASAILEREDRYVVFVIADQAASAQALVDRYF